MRVCLAGLLLLVACGGEAGSNGDALGGAPSLGGLAPWEAGSAGQQGGVAGTMATAGQGGTQEPAGGTGGAAGSGSAGEAATAGQDGTGAAGAAGEGSGGAGGGAAGAGSGGGGANSGGTAGAGGKPNDLEPKPVAGCPGYVKVLVPKGTCVWFHGTHTIQTESCSLTNPPEGKCSTASAVSKDLTSIVSDDAVIERFDLEAGACPKICQ